MRLTRKIIIIYSVAAIACGIVAVIGFDGNLPGIAAAGLFVGIVFGAAFLIREG